ncbi:hypothetical protein NC651_003406 [Populus alba x Populus x berolinensis]|nr:hypothetical protein NC651_003406 [Populus alba x Populus x berolinensis]
MVFMTAKNVKAIVFPSPVDPCFSLAFHCKKCFHLFWPELDHSGTIPGLALYARLNTEVPLLCWA